MIAEYLAGSIADIFACADKAEKAWDPDPRGAQELWFRGQSKNTFSLLPGLYRDENIAFNYDEEDLFERFKARSALFAPPRVSSDWDWYFLSQHHGIPTRLLDWTENLLVATYFAVAQRVFSQGKRPYDDALSGPARSPIFDAESPVVWILDAGTMNAHSLTPDDDYVISLGGELTAKYLPDALASITTDNRSPLAILPPQTNTRIAAQQGVFTIHGHERISIDALATTSGASIHLARIVLDRANLHHIWSGLERAGVNRLMVFPDLDAAAMHTKWMCQRTSV